MKILDYVIAGIFIKQSGIYSLDKPREDGPWEINTYYGYRLTNTPNVITEVIGITAYFDVNTTDARIAVSTEFDLKLLDNNIDISGEETYKLFTCFTHIAISHARILYQQRFKTSEHGQHLIPVFSDKELYDRLKKASQELLN